MVSIRGLIASAVALMAVPTLAAITPAEVVNNIKAVTMKSQALQAPAQSISIINGPLIIVGLGPFPAIITGFADIVTTATAAVAQMQGNADVPAGPSAVAIADAFREFVRVHQALLNILIGKSGLFTTVPIIGAPVAQVLRSVEGVVDQIAFGLIDTVESQATSLQADADALKMTLRTAIDSYDGINV
ncbi:UVI-1 protein [Podospora didyma]|uniref:UVI-1 protein n=1 Tax=Podospora didyma TaxID=330526 RepID=A0AAE0NY17_9PEZI|nr:UVI-1 protein [Podospora didyma]